MLLQFIENFYYFSSRKKNTQISLLNCLFRFLSFSKLIGPIGVCLFPLAEHFVAINGQCNAILALSLCGFIFLPLLPDTSHLRGTLSVPSLPSLWDWHSRSNSSALARNLINDCALFARLPPQLKILLWPHNAALCCSCCCLLWVSVIVCSCC